MLFSSDLLRTLLRLLLTLPSAELARVDADAAIRLFTAPFVSAQRAAAEIELRTTA